MGYVRKRRRFNLVFEDEEFAGLEVLAKSTSMGKILHLIDLSDIPRDRIVAGNEKDRIEQLFRIFMENVVSWNLEHEVKDGTEETPCTYEGLLLHDPDFVLNLALAWMDGVVATPGPLGEKSSDGKPSEVPPIPMEIL
jgi:hypothetical protein